jgi:hypothetical protein
LNDTTGCVRHGEPRRSKKKNVSVEDALSMFGDRD